MVNAPHRDHPLAAGLEIPMRALYEMRYLRRINCEFDGQVSPLMRAQDVRIEVVHQSDRDHWILSMAAADFSFGFMPARCVTNRAVVGLRLVGPEVWREVNLVTMRGREWSPAAGGRRAIGGKPH